MGEDKRKTRQTESDHALEALTSLLWEQFLPSIGAAPSEARVPLEGRVDHPPHNLPFEVTSFIGRHKELADARRLLESTRLLTLTGAGGSGQTRLALHVAAELLARYRDGVWAVELASLGESSLVPQAVAFALRVPEQSGQTVEATLRQALAGKRLLLVMDNCEHVIDACARLVEGLIQSCPKVTILATSREPLHITGETVLHVPTLAVADPQHLPDVQTLCSYEAVQLFLDRAAAVHPSFAVNRVNAMALAQICQRLDGIPLAIALAAARVQLLSLQQISERLEHRFELLTSGSRTAVPRHQTLHALVDWSYDLLSEPEKTLLRRLSVFAAVGPSRRLKL